MICPICLKKRKHFDKHHVIWRSDGGSDDPINLLEICKTCHAILTFGESEAYWYDLACVSHQQCCYGLNFELRARCDLQKSEIIENFTKLDPQKTTQSADDFIKKAGQNKYCLAMAIVHGLIIESELDAVSGSNFDFDGAQAVVERAVLCPIGVENADG